MRIIFFLILLIMSKCGWAGDSLEVLITKKQFQQKEPIEFSCSIPAYKQKNLTASTLHVWIENIQTKKRWRYRYPVVNGLVEASLMVDSSIAPGVYAFNFLLQSGLLKLYGTLEEYDKKEKIINYMMRAYNRKLFAGNVAVSEEGSFSLKSMIFQDSAFFVFSPVKKTRQNNLKLQLANPLDSTFNPVYISTLLITIGQPKEEPRASGYHFTMDEDSHFLPEVIVTAKAKKKIDAYNQLYSTGLFQSETALVFDGLENDEIATSPSIRFFLETKIAGLTFNRNESSGVETINWRDNPMQVYIDEYKGEPADHSLVAPSEVAMIKMFRPPFMLSSLDGFSGAIVIYTKKGIFATNMKARHSFIVKGYTPFDSTWK